MQALINALNAQDFMAFPQKADPTKVTLSAVDAENNRFFLTRVHTVQIDADGVETEGFRWSVGKAMQAIAPKPAPAPNKTALPAM